MRDAPEVSAHPHEDKILLVLTLVIGAVVGLVVVAFIVLTENLGSKLYPAGGAAWRRLVIPFAGALGTGFFLFRYFPEARGSGIPQAKTALFLRDGYISFRTVLGKFSMCSVSLASGIALGREGPSVHVGTGIASVLGRRLGLSPASVRALVPVGASAALAAAFNTPIAAVLFSLEEVMGDMHAPVLGSIVLSSATSWIVLHLVLGDEPLFHVPAYQLVHPIEFLFYAVMGAVGGVAHQLMPDYTASVGAYALVGMGAAFAGIVRVPLTSVIMIFEVTRDYSIIVPLMIANLMSYFISSRLQEEPIYEALQHQDGIHLPDAVPREPEAALTVGQAFRPEPRNLEGPVEAINQESFPHVHPDQPLELAMRRLADSRLTSLPVVNRDDVRRVLGVISVDDILAAYRTGASAPDIVPETSVPSRLILRLLAAVVAVVMLAGFLNYFYRGERAARARRYFATGNQLMREQRYDEAAEQYRHALSISHHTDHRLALGMALLKSGNAAEAAIYLRQVLRERPNDAAVHAALEEAQHPPPAPAP